MRKPGAGQPAWIVALAFAGCFTAAGARTQDPEPPARARVRGLAVPRGVIDMRAELPEAFRVVREPERAIHPPVGPAPGRAGAAAPGREAAGPEGRPVPTPLAPSPPLTTDFEALPDNLAVIPPDTFGAVGPDHLLVTLNSQVRVSTKAGVPLVADRTLNGFWGATAGGSGTFDPRAVYDPFANRWVVVSCDDARAASSAILLAVSQSSDPAGLWSAYSVDVDPGNTMWADYPNVGFNAKWVVVQFNLFTFPGNSFVRSEIYVFDRAALYAGSAPFTTLSDASGFTQVPALTYDMAQNDIYLVEEWSSGAGQLRLLKISGAVGSEVLTPVGFPSASAWNFLPPFADHAPQNDVERIATNDARLQNAVFRNGKLWTAHTIFFPTPGPAGRASVQWWQINPLNAGVVQSGRVDDPTGTNFYAFPSLAVNKLDDMLLGFSCFAATRFASACYAFRGSSDAPGTLRDPVTLKEGLAKYYKIFSGTVNRWGDYSATQVDAVNDVDLWTLQEYAMTPSGQDRWGTWWGHLALPPDITIGDVSLPEGNSATTNASFTISLSFPSTQLVEVDWVAANGSATLADNDFQAASGRASFAPGVTARTVDVPVVGDLKLESNETFVVNLSNPLFGVIADAQGQGTIQNDDGAPKISIDDVQLAEGNAGSTSFGFTVSLSNPSAFPVQASFATQNASAIAPGDYASSSGTVSFTPGTTTQPLAVLVAGDVSVEPDETFGVELSAPSGGTLLKSRGIGTILNDDGAANPPVTAFSVVSSGASGATSGLDRLQWVNPAGGSPSEIRIRYEKGNGCTPPANANGPSFGLIQVFAPLGAPGEPRSQDNTGLDLNTTYCYTIWAIYPGPVESAPRSAKGRPFDATGRVKWKYTTGTGTTGVAAPTVSLDGVFAVDNSGDLHAMRRSAAGGAWPAGPPLWYPVDLGSPSQARNPIVPFAFGSRAYIATQDGRLRSVDTASGAVTWTTALAPAALTGAAAAIFTAFGGEHDAVFMGTSAPDDNVLHARDPASGGPVATFGFPGTPGIGPITGMPAVDYSRSPQNRVYFASRQGTAPETLWCVELGPAGPVAFSLRWKVNLGNISGSPVLRGGRVYVGNDLGEVKSVRAADGLDVRTHAIGDGPVRGFVFPDRANGDVYVSTNGFVSRLTDNGAAWVPQWSVAVPNPSPPLHWPGTTNVYVGGGDGRLYQIQTGSGAVTSIPLDDDPASFGVGAPSLDVGFNLVHVGSVRGTFYAVQVPLP